MGAIACCSKWRVCKALPGIERNPWTTKLLQAQLCQRERQVDWGFDEVTPDAPFRPQELSALSISFLIFKTCLYKGNLILLPKELWKEVWPWEQKKGKTCAMLYRCTTLFCHLKILSSTGHCDVVNFLLVLYCFEIGFPLPTQWVGLNVYRWLLPPHWGYQHIQDIFLELF